jgi:hypothetical protein
VLSEICALLWSYTAYIGICRRFGTTYRSDIQDDADRLPPKRLLNNYQSTLYNLPEERRFPGCPVVLVFSNLLLSVKRSQHDPSDFCLFTFRHGVPSQKTCVCSHTELRTSNLATFLCRYSSFLYYEMSRCLQFLILRDVALFTRQLEVCGAHRAPEYRTTGASNSDGPKSEVIHWSCPEESHQRRTVESKLVTSTYRCDEFRIS